MAGNMDLLRACSVRIALASSSGSGAFVAPGLVLTCAHVVESAWETKAPISVTWAGREYPAVIEDYHAKPYPDLALLRIDPGEHPLPDHPCVLLDREIAIRDPLYAFGFTDEEPGGDSVTLGYEGPSLRPDELHKLKAGQVRPGLSGAALFNQRTGCVCGVLKATRDRSSDLGGRAIPVHAVIAHIAGIEEHQRRFHAADRKWFDGLAAAQQARLAPASGLARNPFLGNSKELIGRDDALRRIIEKLRAGNHCSIVGPRGSGKSALLPVIRQRLVEHLAWAGNEVAVVKFRGIAALRELQQEIVKQLGGQLADDWRSLMHAKPLRLLVLDDLGGMDVGPRGLAMRRWLRGLDDSFHTKLLPLSNERLDILFRKDDPLRDSPLAGIDPVPVMLETLGVEDCRRLVESRLAGSGFRYDDFADLCREPQQPGALLAQCATRCEQLRR